MQGKKLKAEKAFPLATVRGGGLSDEFKSANWDKIRDEIYRSRGA